MKRSIIIGTIGMMSMVFSMLIFSANAQPVQANDIDDLQREISSRRSQIDSINKRIDEYRSELDRLSGQQNSLENDIALIENQAALTELDIQATEAEMEAAQLHLDLLDEQIRRQTAQIKTQRGMLRSMLFELHRSSDISMIELVFSSRDFNDLFSSIEYLGALSNNLNSTVEETKKSRIELEGSREEQQGQIEMLEELEGQLTARIATLETQKRAIDILLDETRNSESNYQNLLTDLRAEQQSVNSRVSQLQRELENRLSDSDEPINFSDTSMVCPVDSYVTTAIFNDPTYPWRHLFEHSGLDMAAPTGTPVRSATSGVVAWTRTISSYGNYIVVIHDNGLSTLYAHLSGFNTAADRFVSKGEVIGYIGSTGFSTGPHLHFEVRKNGIPVNPQNYTCN